MAIPEYPIRSLDEYLLTVKQHTSNWYRPTGSFPWFRGQSNGSKAPLPSVFRAKMKEHDLTTYFMRRAGLYAERPLPDPTSPAQWLSLMQHVGLPTRLLDWTDSSLVGLYFALYPREKLNAAVWILNPIKLNALAGIANFPASNSAPVNKSYAAAFSGNSPASAVQYPIAVTPTQVHIRMAVQRGNFTIHGADKRGFEAQFENHSLSTQGDIFKITIASSLRPALKKELDSTGVRHTTIYPDLEGLAAELRDLFSYH